MTIPNTNCRLRAVMAAAGVASLVAAGCNPGTFVDFRDQAPVISFGEAEGTDANDFGATIAAVEGVLENGEPTTRLAVGGGVGSSVVLFQVWDSSAVGDFGIAMTACESPANDCVPGTGSAIAGISTYAGEQACIAIGEAAADQVRVKCQTDPSVARTSGLAPGASAGLELGASIAAVPVGSIANTDDVMLVGAPGAESQRGSVFRVAVAGGPAVEIEEIVATAGVVTAGARLGHAIATAALPADFLLSAGLTLRTPYLAAISAAGQNRVVLAAVGVDALDATDIDGVVLGCIDGSDGFGEVLAAGDVNGDGTPEVYMGFGEFTTNHPGEVHVIDLADLAALGTGCMDASTTDDPATSILTCPNVRGVATAECTAGAFGSALALGDVDADGTLDLIVGAPLMTVDSKSQAGGVFALAGSSTAGVDTNRASFMRVSNPETEARLGASVAALRTHYGIPDVAERYEVAAGAPGAAAAFIFLCSGLGADSSTTGSRCIEQAQE